MTRTRGLSLAVRNIVFTAVVPGLVVVAGPWWVLTSHGHPSVPAWGWPAMLIIAAGAALYGWSAWNFAVIGQGTPGPWDAPRRVVATGPYRWVRSPMYLAGLLMVLGQAWLFGSASLLEYAAAMALCCHLFVTGYEERTLARRFSPGYQEYRHTVPRWIPRRPHPGPDPDQAAGPGAVPAGG